MLANPFLKIGCRVLQELYLLHRRIIILSFVTWMERTCVFSWWVVWTRNAHCTQNISSVVLAHGTHPILNYGSTLGWIQSGCEDRVEVRGWTVFWATFSSKVFHLHSPILLSSTSVMWWQGKAKSPLQPLQRHESKNSSALGGHVVLQHKVERRRWVEWNGSVGRDLQLPDHFGANQKLKQINKGIVFSERQHCTSKSL